MKFTFFLLSTCLCLLLTGCQPSSQTKKIGIIVPIEHKAMTEIVTGFTEMLRRLSPYPLTFKVANAQGDINLERAIIAQMKGDDYAMVVPIGTDATQMTTTIIKDKPIISLAASMTDQERKQQHQCSVAVVHDEISATQLLEFIHLTYPTLHHITLIHSASDKVMPEVIAAQTAGKKVGITIKPMLVSTLSDLYSTVNNMPDTTQAIFVLKDSLIVSGISTLEYYAEKHQLPLITSDQGSVQDGAAFALGVHENEIGIEGAKLAAQALLGKPACELPIIDMTKLTVFVNTTSVTKEGQSLPIIKSAAKTLAYNLEMINNKDDAS